MTDPIKASEAASDAHAVRCVRALLCGGRRPSRELLDFAARAEERLSKMTALAFVTAMIDRERASGSRFKL